MERTLNIYKYINYALIVLTAVIWYLVFEDTRYSFLITGAGTLIFIMMGNKTGQRRWTILALLTLLFGIDSFIGFNLNFFSITLIAIAFFFMEVPARFLNGIIYAYWLSLLIRLIIYSENIGTILERLPLFIEMSSIFIMENLLFVLVIAGYITSVIPLYAAQRKPSERVFYGITGLYVFIITIPLQIVGSVLASIYLNLKNYITTFKVSIRRQTTEDTEYNEQPAYEIYWFSKAYEDWRYLYKHVWSLNKQVFGNLRQTISDLHWTYGKLLGTIPIVFLFLTGINTLVIGFLLLLLLSIIHVMIIAAIGLPFYIYFLFFHLLDRNHIRSNKVATVCPTCYHQSELPIYLCYNCEAEHTDLRPGKFGIRKRKCSCGALLPTTTKDDRHKLQAKCQNEACHKQLFTEENTPITIPVIGGPSAGKTAFMLATIEQLKSMTHQDTTKDLHYINQQDETYLDREIDALKRGQFPNKTGKQQPFAFNVRLTDSAKKNPELLYLYDPAGESYENRKELRHHDYLNYANAYVLVIDPFSLPNVQADYEASETSIQTTNPSATLPEDILNMLLIHLTNENDLGVTDTVDTPLAVVLNKVDAFQLDNEISSIPMTDDGKQELEAETRLHEQCKAYLNSKGYRHLVKQIETRFTNHQFFMASASLQNNHAKTYHAQITNWLLEHSV